MFLLSWSVASHYSIYQKLVAHTALSGSPAQLGASCNKLQVGIKYFDPAHVVVMRVTAV